MSTPIGHAYRSRFKQSLGRRWPAALGGERFGELAARGSVATFADLPDV